VGGAAQAFFSIPVALRIYSTTKAGSVEAGKKRPSGEKEVKTPEGGKRRFYMKKEPVAAAILFL